jgi:uncharacterized protein (DUF169 family)
MTVTSKDLAILDKFNFITQPVGIKYSFKLPVQIKRLEGIMSFCEMLKKAQESEPFYADIDNHTCGGGPFTLGMVDLPGPNASGEFNTALRGSEAPRAASRIYRGLPRMDKNVVNYVVFASLNRMAFDPDVLIILADKTEQTEILLRALSYKTGKRWVSQTTSIVGCSWLMVYPYLTGEFNYSVTGLNHGMKRRKLFPEGLQFISIPFDQLASLLETLQEMPWVLPTYEPDGSEFMKRIQRDFGLIPPD